LRHIRRIVPATIERENFTIDYCMQIAVANPGGQNLQQHLGAGRLGRRILVALKRLAAGADLEAAHGSSLMNTDAVVVIPAERSESRNP